MTAPSDLPDSPRGAPSPAPATGRRRRRRLLWLVGTIAAGLLLLLGLVLIGLQTERGARTIWENAGRFLPGDLSGEYVSGTVRDGLQLRNVVYSDQTKRITINSLSTEWHLVRSPLKLTIPFLRIDTAELTLLPTPPEPRTLPLEIRLPLAIDLQSATVQQLIVHQDDTTTIYRDIALQANSDRVAHRLVLQKATTPYGDASGDLRLNGVRPFDLGGAVRLAGSYQDKKHRLEARLSGSLQSLGIVVDAAREKLLASANIEATPFAEVPFRQATVVVDHLDPAALNPGWPQADLALRATLAPTGASEKMSDLAVTGPVSLTNAQPGPIDQGRLPLVSATAAVTLDREIQRLAQVIVQLPNKGVLEGGGELRTGGVGEFSLQARQLDLQALHTALRPTRLKGPLALTLAGDNQSVKLEWVDPAFSMLAAARLTPTRISLDSAQIKAGPAQLSVDGILERGEGATYTVKGKLAQFNPALFFASVPQATAAGSKPPAIAGIKARVNMDFSATGALQPEISSELTFDVRDSTYDGRPMTGGGFLHFAGKRVLASDAALSIAGNTIDIEGSFGNRADKLSVVIDAPALGRLGFGLAGMLNLNGTIAGTPERPVIDARYRAKNLVIGAHRLASLSGEAHLEGLPGTEPNARMVLDLQAAGVRSGAMDFNKVDADIKGTAAKHAIRIEASGRVRGEAVDVRLSAQGGLRQLPQGRTWDGVVSTLENRGVPQLSLTSPLPLTVAPGRLQLGAAQFSFAQTRFDLKSLRYGSDMIRSEGSFSAMSVARLLELQEQLTGKKSRIASTLVLDGSWNFTLAAQADGYVQIDRRSGDITIPGAVGDSAMGLSALTLRADLKQNRVLLGGQAQASRVGTVDIAAQTVLQGSNGRVAIATSAPLTGTINAVIPELRRIASLAGPRVAVTGAVDLKLQLAGTVGTPLVSGLVEGSKLSFMLYDHGMQLRDGTARILIADNIAQLQELVFRGGGGTLRATGRIPLDRASKDLTLDIRADNLQLLARPSGKMTISGQAKAENAGNDVLISGKFTVDKAQFSVPEKSAPQLGSDVVVIPEGGENAEKLARQMSADARGAPVAGPFAPRINLQVDLGERFLFEGSGVDLRLAGTLTVESGPNEPLQAFGTVRVVEGSYEAFGTKLAIERGLLNFQGSLQNPNVNILAMRRNQQVAAGVQVTGTVQYPRIRVVSEPSVPEDEQLSWLIFGRGSDSGGTGAAQAQSAAAGAALGLLNKFGASRVAQNFGLDELSIGGSELGVAGGQVVNIGKNLTDRLSIGFEQSLAGAASALMLSYRMTQHWSVVLRGGAVTGMEVLFGKRFDSVGGD